MEVNRMSHSLLGFLKVRRSHQTVPSLLRQCQTWAGWMLWLLCLRSTPLRNSRVNSPPTSLMHSPCVLQPAGPISVSVAGSCGSSHACLFWGKKIIAYIL